MKKILVVYYSQACGNTKRIAEQVARELDADIARIDTVQAYTGSYDEIVAQGNEEVKRGHMPQIKPIGMNVADYDTVVIGTPTWWYTVAPAMLTFLKSTDFTGKTVIPFQTHGGWKGHALSDMRKLCAGATVKCGKDIQFDSEGGDKLVTPMSQIDDWIGDIRRAI